MTCGYCINVAAFAYLELSNLVLTSVPLALNIEGIQAAFAWTQGLWYSSLLIFLALN